MQRRRLLLVTEYFWPDQASTGRLIGELVTEMERIDPGFVTTVVTSNRLYRGPQEYALPKEEQRGNCRIFRIRSYRSGKDRFLKRLWSDFLFSLQSAVHAIRGNYDCLMVVTNPPLMPLVLSVVNRYRRKPFVYLIHDLYPDVPVALGQWRSGSIFVRILTAWQRWTLRTSDRIVVLGRCMKDHLVSGYGLRSHTIEAIPNWHTLPGVTPDSSVTSKPTDSFHVVYSGNLGRFQDFDTILGAAELLRGYPGIRFHIIGDGARRGYLEGEVRRRRLENVCLQPFLPDDEFSEMLRQTHLGLVTLEPQLEGLGVPSKTYNLLAMGIPLLAILGRGSEVSRLIADHRCGFRADPGDAQSVTDFILTLYRSPEQHAQMAVRAQTYAQTQASRQAVAGKYLKLLNSVMVPEKAAEAQTGVEHV